MKLSECHLKVLFVEFKFVRNAFLLHKLAEFSVAAKEHVNFFAFFVIGYVSEELFKVRSAGIKLEPEVIYFRLNLTILIELRIIERSNFLFDSSRRHVEMYANETGAIVGVRVYLLQFELTQQFDEPLERLIVTIDPYEIDFFQILSIQFVVPLMVAFLTCL